MAKHPDYIIAWKHVKNFNILLKLWAWEGTRGYCYKSAWERTATDDSPEALDKVVIELTSYALGLVPMDGSTVKFQQGWIESPE